MKTDFAAIFDMDGVIVDNYKYHQQAWKIFCERHQINFESSFKSKIFGSNNKDHLEAFFNRSLTGSEIKKFENEKEEIYRDLYGPVMQPVGGLIPFLVELNQNKVEMALATSSPSINVEFVLTETGTKKYFNTIVDASMVNKGKPDPEIYLMTAGLLTISPDKCIVFEDSLLGIESAKSAGMKVIGIATTHKKEELSNVDLALDNFENLSVNQLANLI
ncbi:MAG: HAD family phosphatase [Bacteroidales bacterium]|nr:HAD family phosphatase [Bacteroidales bacterium]